MREPDLLQDLDAVPAADACGGRGPLADAVESKDRGAVERRGKKRARRMAEMMLAEQEL